VVQQCSEPTQNVNNFNIALSGFEVRCNIFVKKIIYVNKYSEEDNVQIINLIENIHI